MLADLNDDIIKVFDFVINIGKLILFFFKQKREMHMQLIVTEYKLLSISIRVLALLLLLSNMNRLIGINYDRKLNFFNTLRIRIISSLNNIHSLKCFQSMPRISGFTWNNFKINYSFIYFMSKRTPKYAQSNCLYSCDVLEDRPLSYDIYYIFILLLPSFTVI